ncbi:MAG TPA: tryptophan--tRNA ligase [Candidatus Kerfeldbacteria bacterium]|nr:tryptophan--tRNA ligase [Candidatus Kerfeldbacteria bacterium]
MERILSGIQPSGALHLGNYIGAIKQWLNLQNKFGCYFCIVDYHALTIHPDPDDLEHNTLSLAALYRAVGLANDQTVLFRQSDVAAHTELAWILSTFASMGELERMTQYKDKVKQHKKNNNVGLFTYPVLMAADILLYQPKFVPVGEDQKQHIELTRELAERFNNKYGNVFTVPEYFAAPQGARIMSLDDPAKKMSKSATSEFGYIALTDGPDVVTKKIKKAVTDSGSEVKAGKDKPALTNLLTIYSALSDEPIRQIEERYRGQGYGRFKAGLAEVINEKLKIIQDQYDTYIENPTEYIYPLLESGAIQAQVIANNTLNDVKASLGLRVR